MKTLTDQEKNDSGGRCSIAHNILSTKCICRKNRNISLVFQGTFGIFRCTSKFKKKNVFIPRFLAEPQRCSAARKGSVEFWLKNADLQVTSHTEHKDTQ